MNEKEFTHNNNTIVTLKGNPIITLWSFAH